MGMSFQLLLLPLQQFEILQVKIRRTDEWPKPRDVFLKRVSGMISPGGAAVGCT